MSLITYADISTSLLRYSSDVSERLKAKGFNVTPVDFETYADMAKLPKGDLVGWTDWTIEQKHEDVCFYVHGGIGFSVINDVNLTRLNNHYIDEILKDINSECPPINIYEGNLDSEVVKGHFVFKGEFEITAVQTDDSRSFRFVSVTLKSPQRLKRTPH